MNTVPQPAAAGIAPAPAGQEMAGHAMGPGARDFDDSGYFLLPGFADVRAMREEIYALIDHELQAGRLRQGSGSLRPENLLALQEVRRFVLSESLATLAASFFPEPPVLCTLGAHCLPPGSQGMGLHRDYPYLSNAKPDIGGPLRCLQMILSLDGMDGDNGATQVFPGSHRGALARPVRLECAPGALAILHGALVHSVGPNRSSAARTNLLFSFAPYWVRPMTDLVSRRTDEDLHDTRLARLIGLDFHQRLTRHMPAAAARKAVLTGARDASD